MCSIENTSMRNTVFTVRYSVPDRMAHPTLRRGGVSHLVAQANVGISICGTTMSLCKSSGGSPLHMQPTPVAKML